MVNSTWRMPRSLYITLCSLCWILSVGASDIPTNVASEFYVAFSKNHRFGSGDTLSLVVTTSESEPVQFQVTTLAGHLYTYTLYPSYPVQSISIPSYLTVDNELERNEGIWVRTSDPNQSIAVSGMNYEPHTADVFLALPSGPPSQMYTYIASSMLWNNRSGDNFPSIMLLVGTEDDTSITIVPTEYVTIPYDLRDPYDPRTTISPGESYTVTLNRQQTFQLETALDLTGTQAYSDKPLAVFAGHECADVPQGIVACDHLFEQVPPTSTWGRFFFLVPLHGRTSPDWYRIVASKESTTTTVTCYTLDDSLHTFSYHIYTASVGGFDEFLIEEDSYCYVEADKAVLLMQHAYGGSANNDFGDPLMMMVVPTEQFVVNTTVRFWAYYNFVNYITIIVLDQQYPNDIMMDGGLLISNWNALHCSEELLCGYATRLSVSTGYHYVSTSAPLAVYVYGFEYYQGYGYPAAMSMKNLEVIECEDGRVRLVDGMTDTEGRVEVCKGGQWGTICNDLWTEEDMSVVCGQLDLLSSGITTNFYGAGTGPILLDNVECIGVESSILDCLYDTHTSDCSHYQDAGAVCLPYPVPTVLISQSPQSGQLYSGYDLTLTCTITVDPAVIGRIVAVAAWWKDGVQFNPNWDSRISVSPLTQSGNVSYVTTLSVTSLNTGDSGTYSCRATLTGAHGNAIANATGYTSITIQDLPRQLFQIQLVGLESNCYIWMTSIPGIDQHIASAFVNGIQTYCQCGLSMNVVDQIIVQCFPENLEKVNVILLLRSTPSISPSEMITYIRDWIESDPVITLNETTLRVDGDCDIEIIQGPECGGSTSPTTASTEPPTITTTDGTNDGSGSGSGTRSPPSDDTSTTDPVTSVSDDTNTTDPVTRVNSGSQSQGPIVAGSVLIVVAVIVISLAVAVVLFILVRYRIVKCDNYNIFSNEHSTRRRLTALFSKERKEDKNELVKHDGNEESLPDVFVVSTDEENPVNNGN